MLETKYCLSSTVAPKYYGIPYIISGVASPFLGYLVDKIGRRALLIMFSSVFIIAAHVTTMLLPSTCPVPSSSEVGPLILIGIGFTIYAAALWPSIPYVVEAKTIGTAFGITFAL